MVKKRRFAGQLFPAGGLTEAAVMRCVGIDFLPIATAVGFASRIKVLIGAIAARCKPDPA
jgi:hypothetical protein